MWDFDLSLINRPVLSDRKYDARVRQIDVGEVAHNSKPPLRNNDDLSTCRECAQHAKDQDSFAFCACVVSRVYLTHGGILSWRAQ